MASWKSLKLDELISQIQNNTFVLPVIQRRLVWSEEKMTLLFDTLLKGDSFGGIMVIREEKDSQPLFAFRNFTKDGSDISSVEITNLERDIYLVIDGQQRLQSYFIGLTGSFNGKVLFFNLFSNYKELDFDFSFSDKQENLDRTVTDDNDEIFNTLWVHVNSLYNRLKYTHDDEQVADEYIKKYCPENEEEKIRIRKNVAAFYRNIFNQESIGLSSVNINKTFSASFNRLRVVEEFRRLNDGGTKLSSYDLFASKLKAFNWKMEKFLDELLSKYADIGINQDFLIKLIFLLQNDHRKNIDNMDETDADFAVANRDRIITCFDLLKKYLQIAQLVDYYNNSNRSNIPLYFILYHFFYKESSNDKLIHELDNYDTSNHDFRKITLWLYLSLLNGVFSKGRGWIPDRTGIRKILEKIKNYRNKEFPVRELFRTYTSHPLRFYDIDSISENTLNLFAQEFIFYLLYDRKLQIRLTDIDHIHPASKLDSLGIPSFQINQISNYQLLDSGTNRNDKRAKYFKDWVDNNVLNKQFYLTKHLIPQEVKLAELSNWDISNYNEFIKERSTLIAEKIKTILKEYV